jgi:hypothetical protein
MKTLLVLAALVASAAAARAQEAETASLHGRVTDPTGGGVGDAFVQVAGRSGRKTVRTDPGGAFAVSGLVPGTYEVGVTKDGFSPYQGNPVKLAAGRDAALDVRLALAPVEETVTVQEAPPALSLQPDENAGAIVTKGEDLDALPDDPDEMLEALQALAGPAAGPNGGQVFIDGFTGGRIPPKSSIREIRLNANPFSAEFDRLGYGRIEIFTKPGTDQLRGDTSFRFNDDALNSRNPFAVNKPPYQRRDWSASVSGPIVAKKASFFVDFDRRYVDDNQIIHATVLDPALEPTPLNVGVVTPQHRTTVSPRLDWQVTPVQTLTARYTYTSSAQDDAGIGGFSLPSRAYDTSQRQQTFELTETGVYGKVINETRLRFWSEHQERIGDDSLATLQVQDAFTGGGSSVGPSGNDQHRWELQNITSFTVGAHSFRAGVRLRTVSETDVARQNFGGTVSFAGGQGPQLDANDNVVLGSDGRPLLVPLTSLERYRRTLLFERQGLSPASVRLLGGGVSQLQIVGGDPEADVRQWDVAPFVQDDWRVGANLLVSLGLRYETQDNIDSHVNLAPRLGFAWSAGKKGPSGTSSTVVRGGFGVFYDRFSEDLTLRARRFDGVRQDQYVVADPAVLDTITFDESGNVASLPSAEDLKAFALPQTTWHVAPDLQAPYTVQSSLSLERQLPRNFTATATFIASQGRRLLRPRNVNAPMPDGTRPLGNAAGNVYQVESTGRLNQYQWILGVSNRASRRLTLFARYFLAWAKSDTDGSDTFPANAYDLSSEYGRAAIDVRHRFVLGGNVTLPWGVRLSPYVLASTGRPFNITIGRDLNLDSLFTERPTFAASPGEPDVVETPYGLLDPRPTPGEAIIPRNFGVGPSFVVLNLRLSKTIPFKGSRGQTSEPPPDGGRPGGGPGIRGGFGGGREGRGGGGAGGRGGGGEGGRGVTFSVSVQNLFNRVNPAAPIGNLSSPLFGQSVATAGGFGFGAPGSGGGGNRRIELTARVSF